MVFLYEEGKGVKQSYSKAREYYVKICDKGYEDACIYLGLLYESGRGVKHSFSKAKEYYGNACDDGSNEGCSIYARLNK